MWYQTNQGNMKFRSEESQLIQSAYTSLHKRWNETEVQVREAALDWYTAEAKNLAIQVSVTCEISFTQAAAVIAVSSPRTRWDMQKKNTVPMVQHFQGGGTVETAPNGALFHRERAKVLKVLEGDMSALSGPKVQTFYENIIGNDTVLTLDVWAIRAALNDPTLQDREVDRYTRGRRRYALEAAYFTLAAVVDAPVARVQAAIWMSIREEAYGKGKREQAV